MIEVVGKSVEKWNACPHDATQYGFFFWNRNFSSGDGCFDFFQLKRKRFADFVRQNLPKSFQILPETAPVFLNVDIPKLLQVDLSQA